jgi:hypothetical protein
MVATCSLPLALCPLSFADIRYFEFDQTYHPTNLPSDALHRVLAVPATGAG